MLKKLSTLLSALIAIVVLFPVNISANSNPFISNLEKININEEGVIEAFSFYSYEDDAEYITKKYDDKIVVINSFTNEIVASATIKYGPEKIVNPMKTIKFTYDHSLIESKAGPTPDDYEKWGGYFKYQTSTLYIDEITKSSISTILSLLCTWIGIVDVSGLWDIAVDIYNNKYEGLDAVIYMSTNNYCPILVKMKYMFYDEDSGAYVGTAYKDPEWIGSPFDYSEPQACRVLAQRY